MRHVVLSILGLLMMTMCFGQSERLYVKFSRAAGFYKRSVKIELSCNDPEATIYYTRDGSVPSTRSIRYKEEFKLKNTTVVRAVAVKGDRKSNTVSNTYLIDFKTTFPVVSLSLNSSYLFDEEIGLFQMGPNADSLSPYFGANFWSRKEIQIHTEIFESNKERVFGANTGMRLFGGMSRLFPQKSMAIMTRSRYGPTRFRHQMFPEKDISTYKYFVLRNTGSDFNKSHLRDVFLNSLIDGMDLEKQSFRGSHVFLNGEYWGLYNIREKINRYFVASHTDVHKDSMDLIEHENRVRRGDTKHYNAMLQYMRDNDLRDHKAYQHVKTLMEVENYIDHQVVQIYIDNEDAGGNIKFWRPRTENGRWRWILYDTDWGYGLHDKRAYKHNSLNFHLEPEGPRWPNPPWSTFILRNLMRNEEFRLQFVNRFCDHLNTYFDTERTLNHLDTLLTVYEPEMKRHMKRWGLSRTRRNHHLDRIREFAEKRPAYMREDLQKRFNAGDTVRVSIENSSHGRIIFNDNIEIEEEDYTGLYFQNFPVKINALPHFGYRFVGWEGLPDSTFVLPTVYLDLSKGEHHTVKAIYEKATDPMVDKVMFNEISCNNKTTGDWVELFNTSNEDVNLKDWYFLDTKNEFRLPDSILYANDHIILCEDTSAFKKVFRDEKRLIGNFPFGLSKRKERIQLYTNEGAPIDSLKYALEPSDSIFTLSLHLPNQDNSLLDSWDILGGYGTPGIDNPSYVAEQEIQKAAQQRRTNSYLIGILVLLGLTTIIGTRWRWKRSKNNDTAVVQHGESAVG